MFRHFDTGNTGTISKNDLKEFFNKQGSLLEEKELMKIMSEIDITEHEEISFEAF